MKITDLVLESQKKEETIDKMASALMKLKDRLSKFEVELAKYVVEKTYNDVTIPNSIAQVFRLIDKH